ncbi:MAG TPA: hypothetical protein VG842_12045, partial [Sediminibacterium sp.]|nr:hypothetical protein [Sediminibacterium sp.]
MSKKILLPLCLAGFTQVLAQKDSLPQRTLDEVIVTANKIEQKQSSTGKVVTVITHEQLSRSAG